METIKQVTLLLEKVQEDWGRVQSSDKVTRIDKDILVQDIRQLYELVHELEIGSEIKFSLPEFPGKPNPVDIQLPEAVEPEQEAEPSHQVTEQEQETEPETPETPVKPGEPEKVQDTDEIELEIVTETEPVYTRESEVNGSHEDEETEIEDHDKVESVPQPTAAEKFTASKTLADMYRANGDNSIAAKMQKNKLSDLKSAIGLNEKFLFINKVFRGDAGDYKNAIEKFNALNHFHEALEYLDEIKVKNKVTNKEAYSAFVEILKRRFQ